jgi:hypothetical protein
MVTANIVDWVRSCVGTLACNQQTQTYKA